MRLQVIKNKDKLRTFLGAGKFRNKTNTTMIYISSKIHLQKNDLTTVKVIFSDVISCFIGVCNL